MSASSKYPPQADKRKPWFSWADDLIRYLANQSDLKTPTLPKPVQLAHKLDNSESNTGIERATTDGLVMYDPLLKKVVVAVDGEWLPLEFGTTGT